MIGIMGEYDALPGLSQDTVPERKPIVDGGPGHGCGHNLLGAASLFAAVTIKDWMAAQQDSRAPSASMGRPRKKAEAASCT